MPSKKKATKANLLKVGVDLGTSRSAVSGSTGRRRMVESYVGWPKDFVARKTLGKDVLFGEEALAHRLSLDLVRPLENGVIREGTDRDEEAVTELVGHLIELAGAREGQEIHAAVGVPAEALKINRQAIKEAVSAYAERLMLVSEPFAVAYGMGALDNAMVIDIGAGTVDFCIMHGAMPTAEDQRSLLTAGDYVDRQLLDSLRESVPEGGFTLNMVRRFKEKYGYVGGARKKVEVEIPVQGRTTVYDIAEEMRYACESILPSIVETMQDMIARFDPEFQDRVRSNIILAGGGSQLSGLKSYLDEATKDFAPCKFTVVKDPLYAGADGALELARDMPEQYWGKV